MSGFCVGVLSLVVWVCLGSLAFSLALSRVREGVVGVTHKLTHNPFFFIKYIKNKSTKHTLSHTHIRVALQQEEEEEERGIVSSPGCIPKINFKKVPVGETLLKRSVSFTVPASVNARSTSDTKAASLWGRGGREEERPGERVLAYREHEERGVSRGGAREVKLRVSQTF